jgi:aromatic ring-opening dioxygenase catalytic subunit (LigB family)
MTKSNNVDAFSIMPALYIPHGGGPCFFMQWTLGSSDTWKKMEKWLSSIPENLPQKPVAIVVISAHWEESEFTIYKHERPDLFYDYYGFPDYTYSIEYPAKGSAQLASEIESLFKEQGITIEPEFERGFDHGVFIPLKVMFPEANIPIVQLSLKTGLNPEEHMEAGRAIAPLRKKGILIIGSGNSFHNLNLMMSGDDNFETDDFDKWLDDAVCGSVQNRIDSLRQWSKAPVARLAHPREEHLLPLMVVSGASEDCIGRMVFKDRVMGSLNSAYQFG